MKASKRNNPNSRSRRPASPVDVRSKTARAPGEISRRWRVAGICAALVALIFIVFGPTLGFGFVNYDDNLYVYENATVAGGLAPGSVAGVFTRADCDLYHPLTMISLMADAQIHGLRAGGFHLTNVLLHTGAVLLLFLVLFWTTDRLWASAFVSAIFAVHPLRVESVAWVAERKDVLSAFFFMLTLAAYVYYTRQSRSIPRYLLMVTAFVMALLSKPTVITLPFVLLLLDYWPLNRFKRGDLVRILLEKVPLLALSVGTCLLTFWAARQDIAAGQAESLLSRIGHALVSYGVYLEQMLWPARLCVFYPRNPTAHFAVEVVLSFVVLVAITVGVAVLGRSRRWLVTGWLWYLGMLLPMIGIVQAGNFAHADRMTYLAQIGLCIILAWAAAEWSASRAWGRFAACGLAALSLVLLVLCARSQAGYWRDSQTLWTRALTCTVDNYVAECGLGNAFVDAGNIDAAMQRFQTALKLNPSFAEDHINIGHVLLQQGDVDEAIAEFTEAIRLRSNNATARFNLGVALMQKGLTSDAATNLEQCLQIHPGFGPAEYELGVALMRLGKPASAIPHFETDLRLDSKSADLRNNLGAALLQDGRVDDAIVQFKTASELQPDSAIPHFNLGIAFMQKGDANNAISALQKALQIQPEAGPAHFRLGMAFYANGRLDDAIVQFQEAVRLNPGSEAAHSELGKALAQKGRMAEAIDSFRAASAMDPDDFLVKNNLAWILSTCADPALRNGRDALEFARSANKLSGGSNAIVLHTLAAAFAEIGQFSEATHLAQKAFDLAQATGQQELGGELDAQLKCYKAGRPFHE
jgi:protein O-mannosyl-transferase